MKCPAARGEKAMKMKMKTVVIQIGNTDDKLSQAAWSSFIVTLNRVVERACYDIHFSGGSKPDAPWQNYCVVALCGEQYLRGLRKILRSLCERYRQDSIALTVGDTKLVKFIQRREKK